MSLASFSLAHGTGTNSVFPHVPVSSTASLALFSVANAQSKPASVSCQTSSSTGTVFSMSNLPGTFPAQVCMPQSSEFSCPHSTELASIPVPQLQCYYTHTPPTAIIASLPILSSLASTKGINNSDLSFMSTIKCPQLWPNHYVTRLDASRPAYEELDMAQFVCGYLDSIPQSPIQLQPLMFNHLYTLMDLATRFQWSAVWAFHGCILHPTSYMLYKASFLGNQIFLVSKLVSFCPSKNFLSMPLSHSQLKLLIGILLAELGWKFSSC